MGWGSCHESTLEWLMFPQSTKGPVMADRLEFLHGVSKLHAFYTEQVRMLAHAYNLTDEQAAMLLNDFGYYNVARAILHPPKIEVTPDEAAQAEGGH